MSEAKERCVQLSANLMPSAEKELATCARAVEQWFGSQQGRHQSKTEWKSFELMDWPAIPLLDAGEIEAASSAAAETSESYLSPKIET